VTLASAIEAALKPLGTRERAVHEKAYLKSDLQHLGVTVPKLRAAVKKVGKGAPRKDVLEAIDALWPRGVYELRSACVELLALARDLKSADIALVEKLVRESKTWALVDMLSTAVVGRLVVENPALVKTLDRWAKDDDFWIRRSAMLALLPELRLGRGDFERFGRYADSQLEDKEFFIRKAIGWILRETAKKRPQLVADWLLPRVRRASGLTVREATRSLPPALQKKLAAARAKS